MDDFPDISDDILSEMLSTYLGNLSLEDDFLDFPGNLLTEDNPETPQLAPNNEHLICDISDDNIDIALQSKDRLKGIVNSSSVDYSAVTKSEDKYDTGHKAKRIKNFDENSALSGSDKTSVEIAFPINGNKNSADSNLERDVIYENSSSNYNESSALHHLKSENQQRKLLQTNVNNIGSCEVTEKHTDLVSCPTDSVSGTIDSVSSETDSISGATDSVSCTSQSLNTYDLTPVDDFYNSTSVQCEKTLIYDSDEAQSAIVDIALELQKESGITYHFKPPSNEDELVAYIDSLIDSLKNDETDLKFEQLLKIIDAADEKESVSSAVDIAKADEKCEDNGFAMHSTLNIRSSDRDYAKEQVRSFLRVGNKRKLQELEDWCEMVEDNIKSKRKTTKKASTQRKIKTINTRKKIKKSFLQLLQRK